jgi:hypothetical protein
MDTKYHAAIGAFDAAHPDLLATMHLVYGPNKFECSGFQRETESTEYGASEFQLNGRKVKFRVAKTTPTKVGQFVTLWKRIGNGPIQPYDIADPVDLFVISTRKNNNFGQFVFPRSILYEQDILSKEGKGGKRAMRVYPPWDMNLNRQAEKTQQWQIKYFLEILENKSVDGVCLQRLYS